MFSSVTTAFPAATALAEEAATAATAATPYVPGPVEVGWQIWAGAIAGIIPFAIGAYEFGKRIVRRGCSPGASQCTRAHINSITGHPATLRSL